MWREKNIYFTEHDIYFTKLMFILKNINLELKSALRTKYIFYRILLYLQLRLVSMFQAVSKSAVLSFFITDYSVLLTGLQIIAHTCLNKSLKRDRLRR